MRGNIFSPEYMISNAIALLLVILAWRRPLAAPWILPSSSPMNDIAIMSECHASG